MPSNHQANANSRNDQSALKRDKLYSCTSCLRTKTTTWHFSKSWLVIKKKTPRGMSQKLSSSSSSASLLWWTIE